MADRNQNEALNYDLTIDEKKLKEMALTTIGEERKNLRTYTNSDAGMVDAIMKIIDTILNKRY